MGRVRLFFNGCPIHQVYLKKLLLNLLYRYLFNDWFVLGFRWWVGSIQVCGIECPLPPIAHSFFLSYYIFFFLSMVYGWMVMCQSSVWPYTLLPYTNFSCGYTRSLSPVSSMCLQCLRLVLLGVFIMNGTFGHGPQSPAGF